MIEEVVIVRDRATLCFAARPASVGVLTCALSKNTFITYLGGFQPMRMEASDSSSHVIVLHFLKFYFDMNSQRNRVFG